MTGYRLREANGVCTSLGRGRKVASVKLTRSTLLRARFLGFTLTSELVELASVPGFQQQKRHSIVYFYATSSSVIYQICCLQSGFYSRCSICASKPSSSSRTNSSSLRARSSCQQSQSVLPNAVNSPRNDRISVLMARQVSVLLVDKQYRESTSSMSSGHIVDAISDHNQVRSWFAPSFGYVKDTRRIRLRWSEGSRYYGREGVCWKKSC